jgi:hypothetical protein
MRRVVFAGILTLTHNATSLILPGSASITTAANDVAEFLSLGSGNWLCTNYKTASGAAVVGGGGLTGFTSSLNTASPNNTVNTSRLLASGGTTDQDAVLQPKGAGGLAAQLADSTATGGNKRGQYAVDLQLSRNTAAQVGSGNYTALIAGQNNTASNTYGGCFAGYSNTSSGQYAACLCGNNNTASGNSSVTFGSYATARGIPYAVAHGGGNFSVLGDAQVTRFVLHTQTTSATATALTTNAAAASAVNSIVMPTTSTYAFSALIVARNGTTDSASWRVEGVIQQGASAATTALVGTPTVTSLGATSGASAWTVAAVANTTLGSLEFDVTGAASKVINWVARIETVEAIA